MLSSTDCTARTAQCRANSAVESRSKSYSNNSKGNSCTTKNCPAHILGGVVSLPHISKIAGETECPSIQQAVRLCQPFWKYAWPGKISKLSYDGNVIDCLFAFVHCLWMRTYLHEMSSPPSLTCVGLKWCGLSLLSCLLSIVCLVKGKQTLLCSRHCYSSPPIALGLRIISAEPISSLSLLKTCPLKHLWFVQTMFGLYAFQTLANKCVCAGINGNGQLHDYNQNNNCVYLLYCDYSLWTD